MNLNDAMNSDVARVRRERECEDEAWKVAQLAAKLMGGEFASGQDNLDTQTACRIAREILAEARSHYAVKREI